MSEVKYSISFSDFLCRCFTFLNPSVQSYKRWYVELLIRYAESIEDGSTKRLIVNMPPRHLKSQIFSLALPCWILGKCPSRKIMIVGNSEQSAIRMMMLISNIVKSSWYKKLFSNYGFEIERLNRQNVITTKFGGIYAVSLRGSILGEGADLIIVDDPITPSGILSIKKRKECLNLFEIGVCSRLNDIRMGQIIIIMQRLHVSDLIGCISKEQIDDWEKISIPAIETSDNVYNFRDFVYRRKANEVLDQTRFCMEDLKKIEKLIGRVNFLAQYQQVPAPINGAMRQEWIKIGNFDETRNYVKVSSWDTASSLNGDYSVGISFVLQDNKHYIVEINRGRWEYRDLKQVIYDNVSKFNPHYLLVENKASGQQILQDCRVDLVDRGCKIVPIIPSANKAERLLSAIPTLEDGIFVVSFNEMWFRSFSEEMIQYPDAQYDDQVDALVQYINWIKANKLSLKANYQIRFRIK